MKKVLLFEVAGVESHLVFYLSHLNSSQLRVIKIAKTKQPLNTVKSDGKIVLPGHVFRQR